MEIQLKNSIHQITDGDKWNYSVSFLNPNKSSGSLYKDSLGGQVVIKKTTDGNVTITGARHWSHFKGNKKDSRYLLNLSGTVTQSTQDNSSVNHFVLSSSKATKLGLQGTFKLILNEDPSEKEMSGWIHYIPSTKFLSLIATKMDQGKTTKTTPQQWLNLFGKITLSRP